MSNKAGRAAVDIVADVSKFGAQLTRDLNRELRKTRLDLSGVADQIGDGIQDGVRQAEGALGDLADTAKDTLTEVGEQAREAGDRLGDRIADGAGDAGDAVDKLGRGVKDTLADVGDQADKAGDELGDKIGAGADDAADAVETMAVQIDRELAKVNADIDKVERNVRELAREFARTGDQDIFVKIRNERVALANLRRIRAALDEVGDEAREAERQVTEAAVGMGGSTKTLNKIAGEAVSTFTALGSAAIGLGASAPTPAGLIAIAGVLTAIVTLTPLVIGLVGALLDLVALAAVLPAGLSVLLAVVAPLAIAFRGFGDAVDAIIEGDPEKITEALKGMSPAARSVLREFQKLLPTLKGVFSGVQDAFFTPLKGEFTRVVRAVLPSFSKGLKGVAGELGELAREFGRAVSSPKAIAFLNDLFATTVRILDKAKPGVRALVDLFFDLGSSSLPLVEKFVGWLVKGAEKLAAWVEEAEKTGKLDEFLSDAVDTLEDLWNLAVAVGDFLVTMFSDADDQGRDFIEAITAGFQDLTAFLQSPEGKRFLGALREMLDPETVAEWGKFIAAVILGMNKLADKILSIIDDVKELNKSWQEFKADTTAAFDGAKQAVDEFFTGIGDWFSSIPDKASEFASEVGDKIEEAWDEASQATSDFFEEIGDWFSSLPGRAEQALTSLREKITGRLQDAFDSALQIVGMGIGLILWTVLELPRQIADGLAQLPDKIGETFSDAWDTAYAITVYLIDETVNYVSGIPGRVQDAIARLGPQVTGFFSRTWERVRTTTVNGFNATVEWVSGVPGRISRALSSLGDRARQIFSTMTSRARSAAVAGFNSVVSHIAGVPGRLSSLAGRFTSSGAKIIAGFFSGLRKVGGMAGDVGSAIVASVRGGLNRMIGSINSGIARIDDALPGSLPRIPYLAKGGMTLGPTFAALSETGMREVVLPVEDPRTMAALREALGLSRRGWDSQIVFAEGAISVTFAGVVPTEEEAYDTGRAVGRGVADTLARSHVMSEVRSI